MVRIMMYSDYIKRSLPHFFFSSPNPLLHDRRIFCRMRARSLSLKRQINCFRLNSSRYNNVLRRKEYCLRCDSILQVHIMQVFTHVLYKNAAAYRFLLQHGRCIFIFIPTIILELYVFRKGYVQTLLYTLTRRYYK